MRINSKGMEQRRTDRAIKTDMAKETDEHNWQGE